MMKIGGEEEEEQEWEGRSWEVLVCSWIDLLSLTERPRTCDVYIEFNRWKPSLLCFTNWLCVKLESYGIICFAKDITCFQNSHNHNTVLRVLNACFFGVIILSKKSFANPFSMEEFVNFLK